MASRAITTLEQQNFARRLQDCDGCHDPNSPPAFKMFVQVSSIAGGRASESMFLICRQCATKPVRIFLHGAGYCAPKVRTAESNAEPNALDNCTYCGHQRGFHIHGPCGFHRCHCRQFRGEANEPEVLEPEVLEPEIIDTRPQPEPIAQRGKRRKGRHR